MNPSFYRWLDAIFYPHETTILMYHGFTDLTNQLDNYHGKHLHVETFRQHLTYLNKHYHIISLNAFIDHAVSHTPIPKDSVVLTFDDGYESNYTLAFPLLQKFNAPATIFLTTDFIEQSSFIWPSRIEYSLLTTNSSSLKIPINNKEHTFNLTTLLNRQTAIHDIKTGLKSLPVESRNVLIHQIEHTLNTKLEFNQNIPSIHRPLSWLQIHEMVQSNLISIGAHTCTHPSLAQCAQNEIKYEITHSKQIIEEKLNQTCTLFCYPYGSKEDFNKQTRTLLKNTDYTCALTTITGTNTSKSDLFELRRKGTSNLVGMDNFKSSLLKSNKALSNI